MRIAALAGIRVFATGGIGGVHRGVEMTGDVSADLTELARSPVAVISAGAKAILDLPRTLEMLETLERAGDRLSVRRVPRVLLAQLRPARLRRAPTAPEEIAAILAARWRLSNVGGVLIANPIPSADEIPAQKIEAQIAVALQDATAKGIAGKEVTPFLLARIRDLTQGESQRANVALALNNATARRQNRAIAQYHQPNELWDAIERCVSMRWIFALS